MAIKPVETQTSLQESKVNTELRKRRAGSRATLDLSKKLLHVRGAIEHQLSEGHECWYCGSQMAATRNGIKACRSCRWEADDLESVSHKSQENIVWIGNYDEEIELPPLKSIFSTKERS